MLRNRIESIVTALLLAIFTVVGINAAGPLVIWNNEQRIPYRWDVSSPIPIYTDIGPFEVLPPNPPAGTVLVTNETADATVAFAAQQWTDVPTSSFQAQVVGDFAMKGLPDVNSAQTAAQVIGVDNGGGLYVIYDADAKVMRDFFGAPPSVLGIASPEFADESTGTITEGWVVINAQTRWFNDNNLTYYAGVFTHEVGHAINLAHSQTNGAIGFYGDPAGPKSCSTLPYSTTVTVNDVETMYPFINQRVASTGTGAAQSTVDIADDKTSISNLYPTADYATSKGSISGKILETNGRTGITGVNVIARNLDNPYADAVSAMSGDFIRVPTGDDGTFTLNGLTPGARYALYTDMIVQGGFPTQQPVYLPEGEEFYNGSSESGNGVTDDRCHMDAITAIAGAPVEADIILNTVKGAPKFIPLLPGTAARSVSSDGRVIGGGVASGGVFRWTEEAGYEVLLNQVFGADGYMSRDGQTFSSITLAPNGRNVASILNYGSTWQPLPLPVAEAPAVVMDTCSAISNSSRISANGRAVGGNIYVDTNGSAPGETCRIRPYVWSVDGGSQLLPVPSNDPSILRSARVMSVSDDLSMIVGWKDVNGPRLGVRWVNGQYEEFSTPELTVGEASYVTPDGNTVMGSNAGPNQNPWIWTREGGLKLLDRVAPRFSAVSLAASDNGKVVGGLGGSFSIFIGDASGNRAFLWTPELGSVDLENFLKSQGTFFEGWILWSTNSISADGTTHVGTGVSPRGLAGWKIKLDKVNICHAPSGNPSNEHTITVPFIDTMGEHLRHGDTIGVCTGSE